MFHCRHHLVLDHRVNSSPTGPLTSVLQPSKSFRRYSAEYQRFTKVRRRWSSTDLLRPTPNTTAQRPPSLLRPTPPRRQSSQESSASDSSSPTNWSEYTVRKSLVKFRTRRSAQRWSGRKQFSRTPSNTIKRVLDNVYDISRSNEATFGEKLIAVLYCWYYGWITDVYYSLTDEGREKSFLKWSLANVLVTGAAILLTTLVALGLYCFNFLLLSLMNAGLLFATVLVAFGITFLGFLAIYNYD